MILADRLVALDAALSEAHLPHAFGGAFALAYAVEHPRATVDIDINVFVPATATERVLAALPEGVAVTVEDHVALAATGQRRLWWEQAPLDIFLSTHEFHDQAARRIVTHPFSGVRLPFLHPTDLVVFKAMFDRPKDRVDITPIAAAGTADLEEAADWINHLVGADSANAAHLAEAIRSVGDAGAASSGF